MFVDGKEPLFVILGLLFLFVLLVTLVLFLSQSIIDKENTLMQFEAERGFASSTLMLLQQEHSQALSAMEELSIRGIGVYTSEGRLRLGLGSIPNILPLEKFHEALHQRGASQSTQGVALYNKESGLIEYFRFSRVSVQVETGNFLLEESGYLPSPLYFPDLLYILFDGKQYHQKIVMVRFFRVVAIFLLFFFHLMVFHIYRSNRIYRERLAKQENLVNLGEAARTLAHEIKNPLSAITLQLALLKKTLPKESVEDLSVINQEVDRLTQLTNKVSDFLRNPIGQPEVVDVIALLESIIKVFSSEVHFLPPKMQSVSILFDPDRARSVFENLIKNAIESTQERDPHVEVELIKGKRKHIHIFIRDRGDGIVEAEMSKIFDPFYTTKIHGSGIGLSISRQFIQARGGNLKLYHREGGGTIVEVILPLHHQ